MINRNKEQPTLQELESWFAEILDKGLDKYTPKTVIWQRCATYGWVERTDIFTNLCTNEHCTSCRHFEKIFHETLEEEAKRFKDVKNDITRDTTGGSFTP